MLDHTLLHPPEGLHRFPTMAKIFGLYVTRNEPGGADRGSTRVETSDALEELTERVQEIEDQLDEEIHATVRKLNATIAAITRTEKARQRRRLNDVATAAAQPELPLSVLEQVRRQQQPPEAEPTEDRWAEKGRILAGGRR